MVSRFAHINVHDKKDRRASAAIFSLTSSECTLLSILSMYSIALSTSTSFASLVDPASERFLYTQLEFIFILPVESIVPPC